MYSQMATVGHTIRGQKADHITTDVSLGACVDTTVQTGNNTASPMACDTKDQKAADKPSTATATTPTKSATAKTATGELPNPLLPWQKELSDTIATRPTNCDITWVYAPLGCPDKTMLQLLLCAHRGAVVLTYSNPEDVALQIMSMPSQQAYIFDCTYAKPAVMSDTDTLALMEHVKRGAITSTKHKLVTRVQPHSHVWVFSNQPAPAEIDVPWSPLARWRFLIIDPRTDKFAKFDEDARASYMIGLYEKKIYTELQTLRLMKAAQRSLEESLRLGGAEYEMPLGDNKK